MEKFLAGVAIGCIGGALLATNNYKMRSWIKKSQADMQEKMDAALNKKLDEAQTATEKVADKAEKVVKKAEKDVKKKLKSMKKPQKTAQKA